MTCSFLASQIGGFARIQHISIQSYRCTSSHRVNTVYQRSQSLQYDTNSAEDVHTLQDTQSCELGLEDSEASARSTHGCPTAEWS